MCGKLVVIVHLTPVIWLFGVGVVVAAVVVVVAAGTVPPWVKAKRKRFLFFTLVLFLTMLCLVARSRRLPGLLGNMRCGRYFLQDVSGVRPACE